VVGVRDVAPAAVPRVTPAASVPGPGTAPGVPPAGSPVLVTIYLVLLVFIPSVYVVGPLGAVGTPAGIVSFLMLAVWALARFVGRPSGEQDPGRGGVAHRVLLVFALAFALATVGAALRPMTTVEFTAALRGVVMVCGWLGLALFVAEGLRSRAQLYAVVRLAVWMGTLLALLGFGQFVTGFDIVNNLPFPGLTLNSTAVTLYERAGFARVNATTMHAIEFATVLAMILPLAVSEALRRRTLVSVAQALLVAGALPLTVSRSGMLGLVIGMAFTFLVAGRRMRLVLLGLLPVGLAAFVAVAPGLLGTIRDLFLAADTDTSISARTDDYPAVEAFFQQAPWLGRGPFTFLPGIYRTLDNQYLGTLVEAGLIGLAGLLVLLVVPVVHVLRLARRLPSAEDRVLCTGLAASFAVAMVLFLTFDAFSFPTAMGMLFLLLGTVGAAARVLLPSPARVTERWRGGGRMPVAVAAALTGLIVLTVGGAVLSGAEPAYEARASAALAVPARQGQNIYFGKLDIEGVSELVLRVVESDRVRDELDAQGHGDFQLAVGNGSLAPFTEVHGSGDVVSVSATSTDPESAAAGATAVLAAIEQHLADLQSARGVDPGVRVAVVESSTPVVTVLPVRPVLGVVGLAVLAGTAAAGARFVFLRRR
jgi:O-antigen ligase